MPRLAIVSALHEELHALLPVTQISGRQRRAGRDFHFGRLDGHEVVLVLSGIGKVAAAATAAVLLDGFEVDALLFTGVAGGLGAGVAVGDMVVASELLQHDLDASPLFPRYEVPLTGRSRFGADAAWSAAWCVRWLAADVRRRMQLRVAKAGLYWLHDFRRGHAQDLADSGGNLREILAAGEWTTPRFAAYFNLDKIKTAGVI